MFIVVGCMPHICMPYGPVLCVLQEQSLPLPRLDKGHRQAWWRRGPAPTLAADWAEASTRSARSEA